jgi:tRNA pseudouridine55 synthase
MNGFLLINKPVGPTSHDVIYKLRRILGIKQIGHAGTLDPFASGLLLVGVGEATKLLRHYVGLDKTYEATLKLGAVSDTQDRTGKITIDNKQLTIDQKKIEKVLKSFIGKQQQLPPMHSAKKIGGKRLYKFAREGKEVKRELNEIEIFDIKLVKFSGQLLHVNCTVSSGTFIRTLAHDIGQALGTGAYLEKLKRTSIGDFKLTDAINIRHPEAESTRHKLREAESRDPIFKHIIPLKTVLVSGTFDGLHEGHKNYFEQARQYGQRLIAIIARDKIVEKIKGKKPHYSEKERVAFVKQCDTIDRVYLGVLDNVFDFTASLAPDVIALGYDQTAYTENLAKEMKPRGLDTKILRLKPHKPELYKHSIINK